MALDTVLLAVGRSDAERVDRLAEEVVDVAAPSGATVVLAHVFDDEEYAEARENLDAAPDSEMRPDDVAQRHSTIRSLGDRLTEAGVEFDVRGAVGPHGESIVGLAEETDADRVVVGGRRRSPTGKAVFGSVAQEVLLSSPAPVTFVRADTE